MQQLQSYLYPIPRTHCLSAWPNVHSPSSCFRLWVVEGVPWQQTLKFLLSASIQSQGISHVTPCSLFLNTSPNWWFSNYLYMGWSKYRPKLSKNLSKQRMGDSFAYVPCENSNNWMNVCSNLWEWIEEDESFFCSVTTSDESWIFKYDPKTK